MSIDPGRLMEILNGEADPRRITLGELDLVVRRIGEIKQVQLCGYPHQAAEAKFDNTVMDRSVTGWAEALAGAIFREANHRSSRLGKKLTELKENELAIQVLAEK